MKRGKHKEQSRRTIEELITRYTLNEDFRDVYVEGEWDRLLVLWLLKEVGIKGVAVYDVETVNIPSTILGKHGLQGGKKDLVVALAYELQDAIPDPRQVTCLADKDFDPLLGKTHESPLLMLTDYSCQEMYFLNERVIAKFLTFVVRTLPYDARRLMENLAPTLQTLHLIRAANLSLRMGMSWLPFEKCCDYKNNRLSFLTDSFMERYLSKNSRLPDMAAVRSEVGRLRALLQPDFRHHVTKTDLFDLLAEILPYHCKDKAFHDAEYIARSLAACVELAYFQDQPMYKQLLSKLRS